MNTDRLANFSFKGFEAIGGWTRTTLLNHLMKYEDKQNILSEINEDAIVYDGIEDALVGWVERFGQPPIAIYDFDATIQCLMKQGMDEEDAMEWYSYNTLGSWVGDTTPCFLHKFQEEEEHECRFSTVLRGWWTKTVRKITATLAICGRWFRRDGSSSSDSE